MNNDLISRSALIEKYEQFLARASIDPIIRSFMTTVCCTVKNAPAVDAEMVRHGRWIRQCINKYGHPCHHCSECGFKASQKDRNYCSNCGAKMDAEVEGC